MTEPLWQAEDVHGLPVRLDPDGTNGMLLTVGRQAAMFATDEPEQRAALDALLDALGEFLGREWRVERLDLDPGDDGHTVPIRLLDGQAATLAVLNLDGVRVRVVGKSDTFRILYVREGQ